jgi:hypothetical protein
MEWARVELGDDTFIASLPACADEAQVFTVRVGRGATEIRADTVPLIHPPIFGPDGGDVAAMEERFEEIIKELGLT